MLLQFWLSFNNGAERLRLPVNPESIRVNTTHGYDDVDITQLGEYTVIGKDRLKEYTFYSLFPRDYNASYCEYEDIPDPWESVQLIEKWMKSGKPMRLTITGTPINEAVTIREFQYEERGGTVGDIYFNISFKQYVFISVKKVDTRDDKKATVKAVSKRPNTKNVPDTYVVKNGDSLFKIAQKLLGSGDKWRDIYELNKSTIGANPNLIKVNQKLVIPK
jgi:nucleoid-associated protein YgaU